MPKNYLRELCNLNGELSFGCFEPLAILAAKQHHRMFAGHK